MDILLVSSINVLWPESEIAPYLGGLLLRDILKDDYEVEYIDFSLIDELAETLPANDPEESLKRLACLILEKRPKVVGFYTVCNSFIFTVRVASIVREMDAGIKIVFGGPHASVTANSCMEHLGFLDVICLGESELSIKPLMNALLRGGDMASVPGVMYREGGDIITNRPAALLRDEELGDYTVYDFAPYPLDTTKTAAIEGGRGCPYGCTFCSTSEFWDRRFRLKPVSVLISEMDKLHELYGISSFDIQHDHFTADIQRTREFCRRLIESGRGYRWSCSARADSLDAGLLDLMKEANCFALYLGIETGSNRMQRVIKKNLNAEAALEIFRLAHESGIKTKVSFIYGFAEETEEDFLETLAMIEKIYMMGTRLIQLHPYSITPATEETRKVKDKLYFDRNAILEYSLFNKNLFSEECIRQIEQYPDLYEQYYTFDTPVRKKYRNIDTLILILVFLSPYCRKSMERLIGIYGLAGLYLKHESLFSDLRERMDRIAAAERNKYDDLIVVYGVFEQLLETEIEEIGDLGFAQLCKYERHIVEFVVARSGKPAVHEFVLDMEELLESGKCIEEKCNLLYYSKGGQIFTVKCSSLMDILGL